MATMTAASQNEPRELPPEVLERALRGEDTARRALVEVYERPVFALVSRMLAGRHDPALVEDLAQETFLRVFRALPGFDPNGPARLSTWVLTIATRLVLDSLRRRRPDLHPVPRDLPAPDRADAPALRRRLARAIEAAVADLPADQRATFVLFAWHERSLAEIAEALEVPVGTVKSRLSRARAALRVALAEVRDDG